MDDEQRRFLAVQAVLAVAATVAFVLVLVVESPAHDAPSGWTYPSSCCSDFDCREVSGEAVEERPEGYLIVATGEVIPMTDRKVRVSPDGRFHWCSRGGKPDGATICLFAPHGGS